jgi:CBS domain-containing protein
MNERTGHTGLQTARALGDERRAARSGIGDLGVAGTAGAEVIEWHGEESRVSDFLEMGGAGAAGPRIGDLPIRAVPVVPAHLSMATARKIAELKRAAVLFVERDGRLVGILDEGVLVEAPDDAEIAVCLRPIGLCLRPTTSAARAREIFRSSRASALPVAAGAFLLGSVSRADVERALRSRRLPNRERGALTRATA